MKTAMPFVFIFMVGASVVIATIIRMGGDRLPGKVPGKCLQKEKTTTMQLTSFQLTSSCDVVHVNAIKDFELCCQAKEQGQGKFKRQWAIEMNESKALCLKTCGKNDVIDSLMKNCNLCCRQDEDLSHTGPLQQCSC